MSASKKTPERIKAVLDGLSVGTPLTVICRKIGCSDFTVREWAKVDADLTSAIACAREAGFDVIAMDALSIADERDEDPASRRVMVETRLKLLAKWDPKRYGDATKLALTGADGGPVRTEVTMASPETMAELTMALLGVAKSPAK